MIIEKHILSKSSYIRSLQCVKSLYLYKYHYKLRDPLPPELQIRFGKGHDIGKLAQKLFPGGIDATPSSPYKYQESVDLTHEIISKGYETIYEAAFQFDKVLAVADILVKRSGKWFAYEVKSSLSISETYMKDGALQYFVITNAGLMLEDFSFMYLNQKLDDALINESSKIFAEQSVKVYCIAQADFVKEKISSAKEIIENKILPDIAVGEHCLKPYKCDFFGFCHREFPEPGKLF
ncbi:MAG: hypothetical protein ACHQNT_12145 [Bacteroidia bacterium]